MPAVTTIAMVGLAVAATGAYMQYEAGQDAKAANNRMADAQRQQAQLAQRQADINNARQVRTAVRQARIAQAALVNQGATHGTMTSSGVQGGVASVIAQNSSNMDYYASMREINGGVTATQVEQAGAQADLGAAQATAATGGALGSLGGSIFNGAGGFKTIFDGTKKS
jgi:hypothetical protein